VVNGIKSAIRVESKQPNCNIAAKNLDYTVSKSLGQRTVRGDPVRKINGIGTN
jgi:hypothetical protein